MSSEHSKLRSATPEQQALMNRYADLFGPSGNQREAARVTVACIKRLGGELKVGGARKLTTDEALQLIDEDFDA
jgi:hypothetical protein